ncbi:MAG: DUF3800 domain-containing protein [Chloroflexota bacterium]|nr:DUF3800 domain-containing protein [Chloroflexota bacterium]
MLAFIDESGHPHPRDASTRPVVVCVCMEEKDCKDVSRQLFNLKRDISGQPDIELKGSQLLTRGTFRRIPAKRELVEAFFDLCRVLPFKIFATIMERPIRKIPDDPAFLPNQFRYLLQRADILLQGRSDMGIVLFDGEGMQYGGLSKKFASFLFKSMEGRALTKITDAPFFVDSRVTPGIQIADMSASIIRLYEQAGLFQRVPSGDIFLSAINRYYRILEGKTVDQVSPEGYPRKGFYRMPERDHYLEEERSEREQSPQNPLRKPESQL